MINDNYQLRYLPLFFDDVNSIRKELMVKRAAQFGKRVPKNFLEDVEDEYGE